MKDLLRASTFMLGVLYLVRTKTNENIGDQCNETAREFNIELSFAKMQKNRYWINKSFVMLSDVIMSQNSV